MWPWSKVVKHKTAIFRQVNQKNPRTHHDALEFPDGQLVMVTFMPEGLQATVLQLPVVGVGSKALQRAAYALSCHGEARSRSRPPLVRLKRGLLSPTNTS